MQIAACAAQPCAAAGRPAAAATRRGAASRGTAAPRRAVLVRAQSDEERGAALKAALEQAQVNPEVASQMKQMEEAMANPAMQGQMSQMMSAMSNPAFMQKMSELREDPELKGVFEEIRAGGMAAMMKYMNDPNFLSKIGSKMGDIDPSMLAGGAPAAAAPAAPPAVNSILDAAKYGDLEAIEDYMAIGKGALADSEQRTALHYAVAYDKPDALQALLNNGADTAARDKGGNPPLHYAAGYGREQCVRMLLAAGADVGAKNDRGQTAAEVVRGEPRNPLNQDEALLMQLEGALPLTMAAPEQEFVEMEGDDYVEGSEEEYGSEEHFGEEAGPDERAEQEGVEEYVTDEDEDVDEEIDAEADDEEEGGAAGGGGAGGSGGGDANGQGQMLYIPGLGYIPLSNFPGLGGAGVPGRGAGPAAAPQQGPEGEREWSALRELPAATQDGLLNALQALQEDGRSELTLLVLGKGGVGKSSTVNSILNERVANVTAFQQDTAPRPTRYSRRAAGFTLHLIDTPSLLDQDNVSDAKLEAIGKAVRGQAVDAVLYLDRLDSWKLDTLDHKVLEGITRVLGPAIWDNALLGFSRACEASAPGGVPFEQHVEQRAASLRAAISKCGGNGEGLAVALIENSSRCPTNEEGEKVVPPADTPWIVDVMEKVAEVALNVEPFQFDPAAAARASNPNRRRKWLIPLVLAAQVALKLLLDRVLDEDGCRGDNNGPFDEQTVKERREELKRDKEERKRKAEQRKKKAAASSAAATSATSYYEPAYATEEEDDESDDDY
ncbi:translocase of chloroplast chloroplastic [Micractinium conductrix]|uniref:Translocase of chloroplast chloroplastic n=1 Tax=Micractinium conductrix TaxID=554055 RepID=A0A2P6V9I4_9CHLO|nr:translocase of chloroplast chloroplastic [Micractinium conductrix]|eukprot:PSC70745.1 translocase of chloroplast chloroplastic [Micractinium conductrix]